ncbi:hypothetical protein ROBYS_38400 [Roseobacter sp. OBYS 0001]|nr:hypothetical protein ROBYS_38400 [Roseobacter sp. OBYS 0001]
MHDPSERGARVDLAILAVADRAALGVYNSLIRNSPTKASSVHVHLVSPKCSVKLRFTLHLTLGKVKLVRIDPKLPFSGILNFCDRSPEP